MKLISSNKSFNVFFNPSEQAYYVYKDEKFIIGPKYSYKEVKSYIL